MQNIKPIAHCTLLMSLYICGRTLSNSFEAIFLSVALHYWLSGKDEKNKDRFFKVYLKNKKF